MAIDKSLKGQIKKNLIKEASKSNEYEDKSPSIGYRKLYLSISEAENGYTISAAGDEYIASSVEEVVEIMTTILETSEEIKED